MGPDRKEGNLFGYPGSKDGDNNPLATINDKHHGTRAVTLSGLLLQS